MADITLADVLKILVDQIDEVKENQKELVKNQNILVDATNHKIDHLKRQGLSILAFLMLGGLPVIVDHWHLFFQRLQGVI